MRTFDIMERKKKSIEVLFAGNCAERKRVGASLWEFTKWWDLYKNNERIPMQSVGKIFYVTSLFYIRFTSSACFISSLEPWEVETSSISASCPNTLFRTSLPLLTCLLIPSVRILNKLRTAPSRTFSFCVLRYNLFRVVDSWKKTKTKFVQV